VSLKDMIKATHNELPITMRHETWMTKANGNPVYSDEALAFAAEALAGEAGSQRRRKKMFRASAAGQCQRKQVFSYINMPQADSVDSKLASIFVTGNMLHLKWQLAGLTEGWLTDAEVPVDRDDLNAGGTMDGLTYLGGGFEFKTINSRGYAMVMQYGPKVIHVLQVHHYMLMGGLDHFSVVYENKDTGEWKEFLVPRDESIIEQSRASLEVLNGSLNSKRLLPVLPDCQTKEGQVFRTCPFRTFCVDMKMWPRGK
jgi:hypothetical protein